MAITINAVRMSYVHLFKPHTKPGQQEAKFSVTVLVPKSNVQAKALIDQAVAQAIEAGVSTKWNNVRPPQPALCVYDGDGPRPSDGAPFGEECRGCWVFTATSKADKPPFVVDNMVQTIIDPTQVYSGMWGNVNVNFFAYMNNGKKGIGCALNGVQKIRDGEPLSGHVTAQEAFQPVTAPAPVLSYGTVPTYGAAPAATTVPGYGAAPNPNYGANFGGYGAAPAPAAPNYGAAPAPQINPFTGLPM